MNYLSIVNNLQNEGERLQFIENVITELSKLENAVEKEIFLKQLSMEFELSMEVLKEQLHQKEKTSQHQRVPQQGKNDLQQRKRVPTQSKRLLPAFHTAERMLSGHMLRSKDFAEKVLDRLGLQFNIEEHKAIVT